MNKEILKDIGALCRTCRERVGMTQQDIADRVNCDRSYITRYENGASDSMIIFATYAQMFSGNEWRLLNGIYNQHLTK